MTPPPLLEESSEGTTVDTSLLSCVEDSCECSESEKEVKEEESDRENETVFLPSSVVKGSSSATSPSTSDDDDYENKAVDDKHNRRKACRRSSSVFQVHIPRKRVGDAQDQVETTPRNDDFEAYQNRNRNNSSDDSEETLAARQGALQRKVLGKYM